MPTTGAEGAVVVFQDRPWIGDPRLGAFVAYIDGKRTGVVAVLGQLVVSVAAGSHVARVRQWWFYSPGVSVRVEQGATVRLRADLPTSVGSRMVKMLFTPRSSLVLKAKKKAG